jgi:hypothetical protein
LTNGSANGSANAFGALLNPAHDNRA